MFSLMRFGLCSMAWIAYCYVLGLASARRGSPDAWAAASWARTAITIKRVRATLQFEDEAQDAHSRMAKELSALAEVGFARMVRPHLPQPVVEDLYPR